MRFARLACMMFCTALLMAASVNGDGEPQQRPARSCLVYVQDQTGRGAIKRTRRYIETALRESGTEVLPLSQFSQAAKRARLPKRRWRDPLAIVPVVTNLQLDTAIIATLRRQAGSYQLVLDAVAPDSGEVWAHALVRLRKPAPTEAQAQECVKLLMESLTQVQKYRERIQPVAVVDNAAVTPTEPEKPDDGGWDIDGNGFDSIETSPLLAGIEAEWGGMVRLDHNTYPTRLDDKINGRNAFDLVLRTKAKKQKLQIAATLLVRQDLSAPERNRLEAEEAYVQLNLDPFEIRAGRMLLSWGSMSLVNPSDVLNPVDLREPLQPEKLGVWVLRTRLILGSFAIEAYWLPVAEQSLYPFFDDINAKGLPTSRSRWMDVQVEDRSDALLRYHIADPDIPEPGLDHWQGALRSSASLWGVDVAVAYGSLYDRLPVLHTEVTPAPPFVDIELQRRYERLHFVTAEAEYAIGKWRLATEGLAVITSDLKGDDVEVPNPYFTLGIGTDYRSGEIFHDHRLHVFAEFFWTQAFVGDLREGELGDLRFPLGIGALCRVRYEIGQDLRLDVNFLSSLERIDFVWNPEIEYLVGDNLSVQVGYRFILGERNKGFFGRFRDNSMFVFQVEASF